MSFIPRFDAVTRAARSAVPAVPAFVEGLEKRVLLSARVDGIDASQFQGTVDWQQVSDAGMEFVFQRATKGNTDADTKLTTNMAGGWAAGLLMGAYHTALPDAATSDAVSEANWFLSKADPYIADGYLRPVLSVEYGSSLGKAALTQWVHDFASTVQTATGVEPIIYTNSNYATNYLDATVASYDLWLARYNSGTVDPAVDQPQTPSGYANPYGAWNEPIGGSPSHGVWDFWQYSNTGTVPGITENYSDLDVFQGDRATLEANFVISEPAAFQVAVNFGPYESPVPSGYINFGDQPFGDVFGYSMGWIDSGVVLTTSTSTLAPDDRYRTSVLPNDWSNRDRTFEVAVPNGDYRVRIVAGSPTAKGYTQEFSAEGVEIVNTVNHTGSEFVSGTGIVTVTDGRLSVSSSAASSRLVFLDIIDASRASELPKAPSQVSVTPASTQAIDVRWMDNADNEGRDPSTFSSSTWGQVNEGYRVERRDWNGSIWSAWSVRGHARANAEYFADTGLTAGAQYQYRVIAVNGVGESAPREGAAVTTPATSGQQAYNATGAPWQVPVKIQAEDFDRGGEGISYHDTSPGSAGGFYRSQSMDVGRIGYAPNGTARSPREHRLGWFRPGEWVEYTVDVPVAGAYAMEFRVSAPGSGGRFHAASIQGGVETNLAASAPNGTWDVPDTGNWDSFRTVSQTVDLPAGVQVIRAYADTAITGDPGTMDLDWVQIGRPISIDGPNAVNEGAIYALSLQAEAGTGVISWHIDWGDGTDGDGDGQIGQIIDSNPTTATHTYSDGPAIRTLTIQALSADSSILATQQKTITVNNVSPTVASGGEFRVETNANFTLDLSTFTDPGSTGPAAETYTVSVDWGDGTPLQPGRAFRDHRADDITSRYYVQGAL
jgi:GH25 family lysozyme M1 (1,4-beta-N-acetylmuramidase)